MNTPTKEEVDESSVEFQIEQTKNKLSSLTDRIERIERILVDMNFRLNYLTSLNGPDQ